ncbi:MAG TPA: delta-60 repeat domain-containing protein, partial [Chloroflexia bacterium]|nr:delta-60 repeat domain-containing protein [Chloroflexia bacterium]
MSKPLFLAIVIGAGLALLLARFLGWVPAVRATGGDLDPTFGVAGKVTTAFVVRTNGRAAAVAAQADGKLVVAGSSQPADPAAADFVVARCNPDGSPDPAFGDGGRVVTDFAQGPNHAQAVAIQPDGRIVVAGDVALTQNGQNTAFALARYLPDGSLDATFGSGGRVTTDLDTGTDAVQALVLQADGKIVAVGYTAVFGSTNRDFALARYLPDGSLDASFGTGGLVTTTFTSLSDDLALAGGIQADGKLVAAGVTDIYSGGSRHYYFALVRYTPAGALDTGFGSGGQVTTDLPGSQLGPGASALVIQADGSLVAGGTSDNGSNANFALARYRPDGSLDSSFGTAGWVTTGFNANTSESVQGLALQPDGKIVAAGVTYSPSTQGDFALARYLPTGSLDSSFGSGGQVVTDFAGGGDGANATLVDASGRIVVAGVAYLPAPDGTLLWPAVARYLPGGALDSGFGGSGKVTMAAASVSSGRAYAVTLAPDGHIVAAGTSVTA